MSAEFRCWVSALEVQVSSSGLAPASWRHKCPAQTLWQGSRGTDVHWDERRPHGGFFIMQFLVHCFLSFLACGYRMTLL